MQVLDGLYCFPLTQVCWSMVDWKDLALSLSAMAGVPAAIVAVFKTLGELKKNRVQRAEDLKLKRAEFTLTQHRRLFDDATLNSVLALVDGDDPRLAAREMWEPKRKFLTFFEELCLLVKSDLVSEEVALYMFGYYALAAYEGKNFRIGIAWEERYWGLFFKFASDAKTFLEKGDEKQREKFNSMRF